MFGDLRVRHKFPSRQLDERVDKLPIQLVNPDGSITTKLVTPSEYPRLYSGFRFPGPGILTGASEDPPIEAEVIIVAVEADLARHAQPGSRVSVKAGTFNALKFMRMLAKIAHAHAVAKVGMEAFVPFLPDLILGKTENAAWLVGADLDRENEPPDSSAMHDLILMHLEGEGRTYLCVSIRLFSPVIGMPFYRVVVGELMENSLVPTDNAASR
jgi:hypothetical protein